MKLSKGNLLAVELTRVDKSIPALDNVHITPSGATIGSNGMAVLAVGPVSDEMRDKVPLDEKEMLGAETVSAETIKEILKNMPRDTQFRGVLEHCDYAHGKFELTDGKRRRSISAKTFPRDYVNYLGVMRNARERLDSKRCAVNLKRLLAVLTTLDKICPDSSKNSAVFMEFTSDNSIFIRARNVATDQRSVAYMKAYDTEEMPWPELDAWEAELLTGKKTRKIKKERTVLSLHDVNMKLKEQVAVKDKKFNKWKSDVKRRIKKERG